MARPRTTYTAQYKLAAVKMINLKAFVKLAEVGKNPPVQKTVATKSGSGARPRVDAAAVAREVASLYERAAEPSVTEEQMREACARLEVLKKAELVTTAGGIGLEGMKSKAKKDIIAAITARLLDRKGAAVRGQLIHRPHQFRQPTHSTYPYKVIPPTPTRWEPHRPRGTRVGRNGFGSARASRGKP